MPGSELTFTLAPRRRVIGLHFGAMHSTRRGTGSDIAGSRPYQPGDDVDSIDWAASARLSSARGTDEFIVRERYADEAPRVVLVQDRRPAMAHMAAPLPWLSKPAATSAIATIVGNSALAARGFLGYLDLAGAEPCWTPPRATHALPDDLAERPFDAEEDNLVHAFAHLVRHRRVVTPGSFVFVVSDFLVAPPESVWIEALELRWDVVPVIVQDPVWEQSFPAVGGLVVPLADQRTGRVRQVRLTRREAEQRRAANELRHARIVDGFRALDIEPVVVSSADPMEIVFAFAGWTEHRNAVRGRRI